jgi:hypothetical protein
VLAVRRILSTVEVLRKVRGSRMVSSLILTKELWQMAVKARMRLMVALVALGCRRGHQQQSVTKAVVMGGLLN